MKTKKWYKPSKTHTGWKHNMPIGERRILVLKAHKSDYLASGRAMQSLANVSRDKPTMRESLKDAKYFFGQNAMKAKK